MNADGSDAHPLLREGVSAADPAWSPDGGRIAFTDRATSSIFVVDADGQNLRQVTSGPEDRDPTWSPTGRQIAFSSKRGTWRSLFVVKTDGTGRKRLTNDGFDRQPEWYVPPSARAVHATGKTSLTWGWLKARGACP